MLIIQTTSNSKKKLNIIKEELLLKKLTACTHLSKTFSSYIWKGKIVNEKEYILAIKTLKKHKKSIISIIEKFHNYEIFDLFCYEVSSLNKGYDSWLKKEIG